MPTGTGGRCIGAVQPYRALDRVHAWHACFGHGRDWEERPPTPNRTVILANSLVWALHLLSAWGCSRRPKSSLVTGAIAHTSFCSQAVLHRTFGSR